MDKTNLSQPQNKVESFVEDHEFENPSLQIVELSEEPILADSDRCFWHPKYD